jgi:hypothetical protein
MKLANVDLEDAVGSVLIHNVADAGGHKALSKGHRLVTADIPKLQALGKKQVFVGIFEDGDVPENEAAARIADTVGGENITQSPVSTGRVNFLAVKRGVFKVDEQALARVNALSGITVATIHSNSVVMPKKMVATVKTIGLAVPEASLREVEQIGRDAGNDGAGAGANIIGVRELPESRVALILTGSDEARGRVEKTFLPAIQARLDELGARVAAQEYVEHEEPAIAGAIERAKEAGVDCVILAGETSIMDASDVTPGGIVQAGGRIEAYGAPVEPGNLFLLGYLNDLPVVGAPGCVKSRDINVVDLILPRLLAGERIEKKDIAALANGGLLI